MDEVDRLLFCDCPMQNGTTTNGKPHERREVLAVANGHLDIRDKRHGVHHHISLTVQELVGLLDPRGTSYQAVGSAR